MFAEYITLSDEEFSVLGHNISEMVIFCSFHGEECEPNDFTYFRDPRYGNCVTFNSGVNSESAVMKKTSVAGPDYGEQLMERE